MLGNRQSAKVALTGDSNDQSTSKEYAPRECTVTITSDHRQTEHQARKNWSISFLIPLWIQVCTGAPQFYSYKSWGYRSPPQGNLYRMGVHRFFFASFSLKNGEAKVQKGQVLFLTFHLYKILGCRFHICAPKPGWNILSWLGAWGVVHSIL